MNDAEKAMKMMVDGFTLVANGLTTVVSILSEKKEVDYNVRHQGPNRADDDVRTCTLQEAAKRLNCSRTTISRLCDAGKLQYTKDPRSGYRRVVVKSITDYFHRYLKAA